MALLKNKNINLSEQEKSLLLKFITEGYNCRMELIVDTPENILHDIIKYKGFACNMYKRIIDKMLELDDLIVIMTKILDDER